MVEFVMSVIDKHAPLKKERIGKRKSPWITSHVVQEIRERDYLKRQFDITVTMKFGYNIRKLEMKLTTLLGRLNITTLS